MSLVTLIIPLLHPYYTPITPYYTLIIPLLHPYYTPITPYYTLILPLLHPFYTLIIPLFVVTSSVRAVYQRGLQQYLLPYLFMSCLKISLPPVTLPLNPLPP
jgi:hypothetical protein